MSRNREPGIPVRVFYDFAESPIWAPFFTAYKDAGLSAELERDFRQWCEDIGPHMDHDRYRVVDAALESAFEARGRELCERLSTELGSDFTVAFEQHHMKRIKFRSAKLPANPRAAALFRELAD